MNSEVAPTLTRMVPLSSIPEPALLGGEPQDDPHTHLGRSLGTKTSGRTEKQNDTEQSKVECAEPGGCLPGASPGVTPRAREHGCFLRAAAGARVGGRGGAYWKPLPHFLCWKNIPLKHGPLSSVWPGGASRAFLTLEPGCAGIHHAVNYGDWHVLSVSSLLRLILITTL